MTAKIYSFEKEKKRRAPITPLHAAIRDYHKMIAAQPPPSVFSLDPPAPAREMTVEECIEARERLRKAANEVSEMNERFQEELARRRPEGFTGVVMAELFGNDSDSMSDYYEHRVVRRVVIGFTKTPRSAFGNMRKAAATFGPTSHLGGTRYADHEHRENWSMGGGMYLKHGSRHEDGWTIRIESAEYVYGPAEFSPFLKE